MKSVLAIVVVLLLALGTQAFAGGQSDRGAADGAITLGITWWGPDARHQATLAALELYSERNPNIVFDPEPVDWTGFWDRLPTLAAAGTIPDVLQMDAAFIDEYVDQGVLANLSDVNLTGIVDPIIVDNLKIDGVLYGIPLSHNAGGMAYHTGRVAEYGITPPRVGWTFEEYFDWAREAREKLPPDKWGITDGGSWEAYQYYQMAHGQGNIFQDVGRTFNFDRDLWFQYMAIYQSFRDNNVVPPPDIGHLENDPIADPMASGDVIVVSKTVGSVSALEQMMPGQVVAISSPVGPTGIGSGWAQSTIFMSVAENSRHQPEAKTFVRWFISDVDAGRILGTTRGMPINDAVFQMLEPNFGRFELIGRELLEASLASNPVPFSPIGPGWIEWRDLYNSEYEAVAFRLQTAEGMYRNLMDLAQDILARPR